MIFGFNVELYVALCEVCLIWGCAVSNLYRLKVIWGQIKICDSKWMIWCHSDIIFNHSEFKYSRLAEYLSCEVYRRRKWIFNSTSIRFWRSGGLMEVKKEMVLLLFSLHLMFVCLPSFSSSPPLSLVDCSPSPGYDHSICASPPACWEWKWIPRCVCVCVDGFSKLFMKKEVKQQ